MGNQKQFKFLSLNAPQLSLKILDRLQYWKKYQYWRTLRNFSTIDSIVCKQYQTRSAMHRIKKTWLGNNSFEVFSYCFAKTKSSMNVWFMTCKINTTHDMKLLYFERKYHRKTFIEIVRVWRTIIIKTSANAKVLQVLQITNKMLISKLVSLRSKLKRSTSFLSWFVNQ